MKGCESLSQQSPQRPINRVQRFENFYREFLNKPDNHKYEKQIGEVYAKGNNTLFILYEDLLAHDPQIADMLKDDPELNLEDAIEAFTKLLKYHSGGKPLPYKRYFVRIVTKDDKSPLIVPIRNLRSRHIGSLIRLKGILTRCSDVKSQLIKGGFECLLCGSTFDVFQLTTKIKFPSFCINKRCKAKAKSDFKLISKESKFMDVQNITIQEIPEDLPPGRIPRSVSAILIYDLVDCVKPGDRVYVTGIYKSVLAHPMQSIKSNIFKNFIEVNFIESEDEKIEDTELSKKDINKIKKLSKDPKIHEKIMMSIAPMIHGRNDMKMACALSLFGGTQKNIYNYNKRGNIHVLFIGDAGTGKSLCVDGALRVAPRGIQASGSGATGIGLCVDPNTIIIMENGGLKTIKEVVDKYIFEDDDLIYKNVNFKIVGFDNKTLKIQPMKVSNVWKIKSPNKLLKITTKTGTKIKVTLDNPILTIRNGKIIWINAKEIKKGDRIGKSRIIKTNKYINPQTINLIDKNAHLINSSNVIEHIREECSKKGMTIRDLSKKTSINENNLYHNWRYDNVLGNPKISDLFKLYKVLGISSNNKKIPSKMILSQWNGHNISFPKKITKDLLYFMGLISGDGNIYTTSSGSKGIRFYNKNEHLLYIFQKLINKLFFIQVPIKEDEYGVKCIRFHSKIIGNFLNKFGIPSGKKSDIIDMPYELTGLNNKLLGYYLKGLFDTDGSVGYKEKSKYIEFYTNSKKLSHKVQLILLKYGIISSLRNRSPKQCIFRNLKYYCKKKYIVSIHGLKNFKLFKKWIGFNHKEKKKNLDKLINSIKKSLSTYDTIPCSTLLKNARLSFNLTQKELYGYKGTSFENNKSAITRNKLKQFLNKLPSNNFVDQLNLLYNSDIFWDRVKDIEIIKKKNDYVYDLTIEESHSFIGNGLIVHNTAAVIKDPETKEWILEAGAVVLANGGIAVIDEFDKMGDRDRGALHEQMEQCRIAINKAGINAVLKADTSIIAVGNPKGGRYDPYKTPTENIKLPPTLLSRFDLIFVIKDIPEAELDGKIADFILDHSISNTTEIENKKILIPQDLLKKYIKYAKKTCHPYIDDKTKGIIKRFYLKLRNEYDSSDAIVSILPRHLDALIRLSESHAKMALRDKVLVSDVEASIKLFHRHLQDTGYDQATGKIDIDRVMTGHSRSTLNKLDVLMKRLDEIFEENNFMALEKNSVVQILEVEDSLDKGFIEDVFDEFLSDGTLYTPKNGHIKMAPKKE